MSAELWLIIAIIGFSLSGIALVAAIFMFLKMNIPAVIGDLSGKTVAREIKAIREANASSGDKRYKSSRVNRERGPLTEPVKPGYEQGSTGSPKQNIVRQVPPQQNIQGAALADETVDLFHTMKQGTPSQTTGSEVTEALSTNATEVLSTNATEVLNNATEVLSNETEKLSSATEVLTEEDNSTTILNGTTVLNEPQSAQPEERKAVPFKVIREEILIHAEGINS